MKKYIKFLTILCCLNLTVIAANCQSFPKTEVSSIKTMNANIEITISSTQKFYVGGNIHILHIGNKTFSHSKNGTVNGLNTLTFLIPLNDFNLLNNGDNLWMTYGNKVRMNGDNKVDIKKMSKENPTICWDLGKFNKNLLDK